MRQHKMELNESHTLYYSLCRRYIIIMGDTKQDVTDNMSSLMRVGRYLGLSVNEEKLNIYNMYKHTKL